MHNFRPFTVTVDDSARTIKLAGEVDLATAPALASVAAGPGQITTVDLSRVTFLDTTVLQFLVGLDDRLKATGKQLTVVGASPAVRKLFAITGMLDLLGAPHEPPALGFG